MTVIGGPLIRIARLRAGLTQRELAALLALPQSSIARWESGARQPTIDNMLEAVRACGLDVTVGLDARDRSADAFIWELLDETPAERLRRQVAVANATSSTEAEFDPRVILLGLADRGVRFVLIGRLAENVRGCPLVPPAEVVVCPDDAAANRAAITATMLDLGAESWQDGDRRPAEPPLSLRPFVNARRWRVERAGGALAVVDTPHGTAGYDDLVRSSRDEDLGRETRVAVASLLDLIRVADAAVDAADRGGLPTLRRAYELSLDYVPADEREFEVPEGLEELFAEHGIR